MGAIWLGSWLAQSITGVNQYNAERLDHQQAPVSWLDYLGRPDFWEKTLQNWQSEFLAVGVDGDPRRLPAPARLARVKARRGPTRGTGPSVEGSFPQRSPGSRPP